MFTKSVVLFAVLTGLVAVSASASDNTSTVAVGGYDVVSYFTEKRPIRGNGHFVSEYEGATYVFENADNKKKFDRNPKKYAPAYGGFCAFGVSVGKKFVGDPEVWRIIDGVLYLNLDTSIQDQWLQDTKGRIKTANKNWKTIKDKAPSEL